MYKVLKTELKYLVYFLGYDDLSNIKLGIFLLCLCILCVKLNMEIERQNLFANKMGKFLAMIMKITFYRKKIAILSRKTSNFAITAS